jgi:hypothetical protein
MNMGRIRKKKKMDIEWKKERERLLYVIKMKVNIQRNY